MGRQQPKRLPQACLVPALDTLRANASTYAEKRMADDAVAADLTKALGFEVTAHHVHKLKQLTNLKWGKEQGRSAGHYTVMLAKSVLELSQALGHTLEHAPQLKLLVANQ